LLLLVLTACARPEPSAPKVPLFLLLQASPDRLTLEAIVPQSLIRSAGNVQSLEQELNKESAPLAMMQFGKLQAEFLPSQRRVVENFGGIAVFKLNQPFKVNRVLSQQGIIVLPQNYANPLPAGVPSYQYNCPPLAQDLVLKEGQAEFLKLGIAQDQVARVAIASIVCADLDGDQLPEIISGLRLDNALRPTANDTGAWQKFLSLAPDQRQEYSILAILRGSADNWTTETIIAHRRSLAYLNDSVSSYVLVNAHDLDGDRRLELVVQEIGLSSINVWVLTPNLDPATAQAKPWMDYYLPERSLNLQE
jgi:hypothetical protein